VNQTPSRTSALGPFVRRLTNRFDDELTEPPFRLVVDEAGVLWMEGGLDLEHVAEVRAALRATDPTTRTVVDLSALHFIDSSGLGCLLAHDDRVRREGGQLVLRAPGPALSRVFQVTGADTRLSIEPTQG
jgi:anti-sigma B factor antagonist